MDVDKSIINCADGTVDNIVNCLVIKKRGRKQQLYRCDECLYSSKRNFNVQRHKIRIHTEKINKKCCGKRFRTKADWYYHVEDFHPGLRENSYVSKKKYQILGSKAPEVRTNHQFNYSCRFYASETQTQVKKFYKSSKRTSLRIKNKLERKCALMVREFNDTGSMDYDLDDMPLYYRKKYPQLRYRSPVHYQLPVPETDQQSQLNTQMEIDFSSDFTNDIKYSDASFGSSSDKFNNYSDFTNNNRTNDDNNNNNNNYYYYDSNNNYYNKEILGSGDDSGFNESFIVPEVHHEEIIEHSVEEEAHKFIEEDKIDDNYYDECKIHSVMQKSESMVSKIDDDKMANLNILPPKKRILRQWETNVISTSVRQLKPKLKNIKKSSIVGKNNEENNKENGDKGFKIVVRREMSIWEEKECNKENEGGCKVVIMEEKSREVYWNAEERHRAFLNSFDFDRFKIL
ncbi:myb-like protein W [Microplitis mediator]|uniref:myb-like protein W n=1 Tax=Microplitis mediator TaxID=375433 RepID=UPI0025540246|nr:myb-like protein W [Microplitis mediator]